MISTLDAPAPRVWEAPGAGAERRLALWHVIGGSLGLLAAFVLIVEKIATLQDPGYVPSCSLNPVLSCGSIMNSSQAALFGFPNPLLGVAGFPVVVVSGVAVLAGFRMPRWYRVSLLAGMSLAVVFVHWLIWVSLYQVGALCPYCMAVWVVTVSLWWYTLLHAVPLLVLRRFHSSALATWAVVVVALIFVRFRDFWVTIL